MLTESEKNLQKTLAEFFALGSNEEVSAIKKGQTPFWDSLNHLELVMVLESEFGITLSTNEVLTLEDYQTLRDILQKHGVLD